jgi:arsenite-transporting ATPase
MLSLPPVLVVGGKGGVGKTSVSCALALAAARAGHRTLLVSTDPAPSIGDALDQAVGDDEQPARDGFGLVARQIDATAAFARWRAEYRARVDAAFDALLGPGVDAAHDRAIARDLLALAPPGIDELYALIWLGDAVAEGRFERIVIDPAPTGHLIRLLEMPALALDWSHRLLRLMLKYPELAGGGETSAELLAFARRTRAVGDLLRDGTRAGVMVVTLDEPIVRLESERVVRRIRALGNHVPAVLWNRARRVPRPLPADPPVGQFVASDVVPPPVGAARLLAWFEGWRALRSDV